MADKLDDKGFLQRWSTRKMDARTGADVDAPQAEDEPVAGEAPVDGDETVEVVAPPPTDLADLPDVDTLDADSDYTGFLGENVPADLAKMAMRKLWRSDPVLANIDGLNDYDEDFSMVGMVSEVVKTAYQVGKGYVTADDELDGELDVEADDEMVEKTADEAGDETGDGDEGQIDDDVIAEDVPALDGESGEKVQDDEVLTSDLQAEAELTDESDAPEFHNVEKIKPT